MVKKIKPLQWRVKSNGTKFCTTPVGHYELDNEGYIFSPFVAKYDTYSEALQVINIDYYDKVNQCLIKD
jgi:hypothetical protein